MTVKSTVQITDPLQHAAQLEEYKTLRKKIDLTMSDVSTTERWVMVGIVSVWTWLVTNPKTLGTGQARLAWWIPVFLAVVGTAQTRALRRHINLLCDYLRSELEERLGLRWQQWYENRPGIGFLRLGRLYWPVMIVVTIIVALWA